MRKYWAIIAILVIATSNISSFAKGKARFSISKKQTKKKKKKLSLNMSFCELVKGPVSFLVCASGNAGKEKLSREDLYSIKESSVLLSKKIQTSKAKKISFQRAKNKKTRKASRIVKANPKYCSVLKGTPNITVCAQGKPGQASITGTSLSSVQEAAITVQKKYNKANRSDFISYVIDNMSVQSCEYIYGVGDYRCAEDFEGTSCDADPNDPDCIPNDDPSPDCTADPYAEGCPDYCMMYPEDASCVGDDPGNCAEDPYAPGCPDFCMMNPEDPSCTEDNGPDCSDPSGPYYDVVYCEGPSGCDEDPYAVGCPDYCMMNPSDPACTGNNGPDCSDPSGPYYDVVYCEGPTGCEADPYAPGCPDYCMLYPEDSSCY